MSFRMSLQEEDKCMFTGGTCCFTAAFLEGAWRILEVFSH